MTYSWLNSAEIEIGTSESLAVSITDTYTLIVTNQDNGCSSTDEVIVSQDANVPTSDAGVDGILDCTNVTYSLNGSNSSGGNLSYSWLNSDDVEIGTSETLEVSIDGDKTRARLELETRRQACNPAKEQEWLRGYAESKAPPLFETCVSRQTRWHILTSYACPSKHRLPA